MKYLGWLVAALFVLSVVGALDFYVCIGKVGSCIPVARPRSAGDFLTTVASGALFVHGFKA